jgi:hypothetical protein
MLQTDASAYATIPVGPWFPAILGDSMNLGLIVADGSSASLSLEPRIGIYDLDTSFLQDAAIRGNAPEGAVPRRTGTYVDGYFAVGDDYHWHWFQCDGAGVVITQPPELCNPKGGAP